MSIDIDYTCSQCDSDEIAWTYWQGYLFNYSALRCLSCNEADHLSRAVRMKQAFRRWVNSGQLTDI